MIKGCFLVFVFIVVSANFVSSLGISPAIKDISFVPNQEIKITFFSIDTVEGAVYDISLGGDELSNYASLSADTISGAGSVVLTIKFPEKIDRPGEHTLSVSIKERPSEESFINTIVQVGAIIKIFVPYPGIYGDLSLNIPDGNIDESIPVELHIINRGDNALDVNSVFIDFISSNGTSFSKLDFTTPVNIPVSGDRYFRKYLNTNGFEPGNYIGSAKVSYSGFINEVNKSFRIGSLFVNITNYTNFIVGDGIQKFYVSLENKWNSPISGIFVDINLSNGLYSSVFRTPSVDLKPWEEKVIESYLDAEDLEGNYNLILNASYHGKYTVVYGTLFVGKDYSLIIYGVSALVAVIFFVILYFIFRRFFMRSRK